MLWVKTRRAAVAALLALALPAGPAGAAGLELKPWLDRPGVRLVAVEFYATWCTPCMDAVPRWQKLRERYGPEGLRLIAVLTQDPDGRCALPGWSPDEVICDPDGHLARALAVGRKLPPAFLWSWQGNLLVERGHVDAVAGAVQAYLKRTPSVLVEAKGDLHVDAHHTVEDVAICLGQALHQALGEKKGIVRFGSALVPMDESLAQVAIDLSGRPCCVYDVDYGGDKIGEFDVELVGEFLRGLANAARMNLHVNVLYGSNNHHIAEAIFKALGRALRMAVARDDRCPDVPSTKGVL